MRRYGATTYLVPDKTPFSESIPTPGPEMSVHSPKFVNDAAMPLMSCAATEKANGSFRVPEAGDVEQASTFSFPAARAKYRLGLEASFTASFTESLSGPPSDKLIMPGRADCTWWSAARAMPTMTPAKVPLPDESSTFKQCRVALGATPCISPVAVPATCVPCPFPSTQVDSEFTSLVHIAPGYGAQPVSRMYTSTPAPVLLLSGHRSPFRVPSTSSTPHSSDRIAGGSGPAGGGGAETGLGVGEGPCLQTQRIVRSLTRYGYNSQTKTAITYLLQRLRRSFGRQGITGLHRLRRSFERHGPHRRRRSPGWQPLGRF